MADMLTIASLSLNTFKKALEVTSHNVANASTEGYNMQRVIIQSSAPGNAGNNYQGSGSTVGGIERIYSEALQTQLYSSQTLKQRYETQLDLSTQVEGIVASNDEGVQEFLNRYLSSLQALSDNPTSTTSRQQVLDEVGNLESHINNLTSVLGDTNYQTNNQVSDIIEEVNNRLQSVQEMNTQIDNVLKNTTNAPNDLMDQRDQAILEISQYMDIKTYYHDNGSVDIYAGNGQVPLLSSNTLMQLEASRSEFQDENRTEVYAYIGDQKQLISDKIVGGELGGVLDFRDNMLGKAQNDLGLTLNGMVASMNWQHYQGYDANGDAGGNIFAPLSTNAIDSVKNTGTVYGTDISVSFNPNPGVSEPPYDGSSALASQPATYGDKQTYLDNANTEVGNFEPREYKLMYNQGTDSFDFFDYITKQAVVDSSGNPISVARGSSANVEGLYFDFTGVTNVPADEDSFLVKPHKQILEDFAKVITEQEKFATRGQSPIDSNSDGSLDDEVPAAAAKGDNVNIANMAGLQSAKLLFAGADGKATESLLGGYSKMAVNVGMYVRGTDIQYTAQSNVYDVMVAQRESYSGVSLDEEAANLVKYQQAYQASAQIVSTVQELFQTLLGISRA
ncbi:flagellar hook-associated protein FlgK [Thiomicrorhabdus sp. Milos-T2]|uniref:flagellar hook-associated protein FlgK n=1 Tax=Thiomicrorhabdus sp. Milos-T2 TaxID=90814 RepID=UPI000494C2F8|nr:flagellar hook-associated protein FlgK [Thiomicrorhabdus sp. Milos-T2]